MHRLRALLMLLPAAGLPGSCHSTETDVPEPAKIYFEPPLSDLGLYEFDARLGANTYLGFAYICLPAESPSAGGAEGAESPQYRDSDLTVEDLARLCAAAGDGVAGGFDGPVFIIGGRDEDEPTVAGLSFAARVESVQLTVRKDEAVLLDERVWLDYGDEGALGCDGADSDFGYATVRWTAE